MINKTRVRRAYSKRLELIDKMIGALVECYNLTPVRDVESLKSIHRINEELIKFKQKLLEKHEEVH